MKHLFGSKVFIWTQDVWPESVFAYGIKENRALSHALDLFVSVVYKSCRKIFVSCRGFKERVKRYAGRREVEYVPQWVPGNLFFDGSRIKDLGPETNFTFAGNIGKVQNLESVIRGFQLARETVRGIQLNIIGDGSNLDSLKDLVAGEGIDGVVFWGRKDSGEMPAWLLGSDVLIISLADRPIFRLTVPLKFQTYLAAQRPILCIMKGEVADVVRRTRIGVVADPNNVDDIKNGFSTILSQVGTGSCGENAAALLSGEYDRAKNIAKLTREIFENG
jgi:glycosyltransferase involved in cell wall biosynthesis